MTLWLACARVHGQLILNNYLQKSKYLLFLAIFFRGMRAFLRKGDLFLSCACVVGRVTSLMIWIYLRKYKHGKIMIIFPLVFRETSSRSSHKRCSVKKVFFWKVQRKTPVLESLFKKRPWHSCFPMNFANSLKTSFLKEHLRGCFCMLLFGWEHVQLGLWLWKQSEK